MTLYCIDSNSQSFVSQLRFFKLALFFEFITSLMNDRRAELRSQSTRIDRTIQNLSQKTLNSTADDVTVDNNDDDDENDDMNASDRESSSSINFVIDQFKFFKESTSLRTSVSSQERIFDVVSFVDQLDSTRQRDMLSLDTIIIDESLQRKKLSNFFDKKRNHIETINWLDKHESFHRLNRHMIASNTRIDYFEQYLIKNVVNWFKTLSFALRNEKFWIEFRERFLQRWDDSNWWEQILEIFNALSQSRSLSDINDFNTKFTRLLENVHDLIDFFVAKRRYIEVLKSRTRNNLKQILFIKKNIIFDEMMKLTKQFENFNVKFYNREQSTRRSANNASIFASNDIVQRNFQIMQIENFKCYNCDQFDHKVLKCKNAHVSNHASIDWKSRKKSSKKD